MRMAPPGRTFNSQTGFVNPFGPHHCATCFGSVHALNTSSRGASKTRVMTSSRSVAVMASLVFALLTVMLFLLVFRLAQISNWLPSWPLAAGHGPHAQKRLGAFRDRVGQRGVRRFVG